MAYSKVTTTFSPPGQVACSSIKDLKQIFLTIKTPILRKKLSKN
jgi:hypothetical protein